MTVQATGYNEKEVLVPMTPEELDSEIGLLNDCLGRYGKASVEKKMASEALKEVEAEKDVIIGKIVSKKCFKTRPVRTVFNWASGQKKEIAVLENGEIFTLFEGEITDRDRQLNLIDMDIKDAQELAGIFS